MLRKHLVIISAVLCVFALFACKNTSENYQPGDQVLALWQSDAGDTYWIGSIIDYDEEIDEYLVLFADNSLEYIISANIVPLRIQAGTQVFAKWADDKYYRAQIDEIIGRAINVTYEDGTADYVSLSSIAVDVKDYKKNTPVHAPIRTISGPGFSAGDTVFAEWAGDGKCYIATIIEYDEEKEEYLLLFEDNDTASIKENAIFPFTLNKDDTVGINLNDNVWHEGKVAKIVGNAILAELAEGGEKWIAYSALAKMK